MRYGLWLLLLLLACGEHSPPVAPPAPFDPLTPTLRSLAIQSRLMDRVAYLYVGINTVWWVWKLEGYEFGQLVDGRLVLWEQGVWWVQQFGDRDFLVLDMKDGAQLLQTDNGLTWRSSTPAPHRIPFSLLGTSLQDPDLRLEMDVGRLYTYRLAPLDSLEAIKAHRLP